ncbi:Kinase, NEK [Giardia muris]|uniref:Kinase, NEK n=1 Tax=Giardia muris TaxID=5742 RepID=A0A4Z1SVH4_GIAMU|nr:Kinase, NEK [Giardia muris]|eukprot:TNJ29650.1 Kinase, NEK [Giardia muris]
MEPISCSRYDGINVLHRGESTIIYSARNTENGKDIVVKQVFVRENDELYGKLLHEYNVLRDLKAPQILGWERFDEQFLDSHGVILIEMRHLKSRSLEDLVSKAGPIPIPQAITFVMQVAYALASMCMAKHPIIHRAIIPQNVILTEKSCVLKGFKYACYADQPSSIPVEVVECLPPEIDGSHNYSFSSDIWSLGCLFYYCLEGRMPDPAIMDERVAVAWAKQKNLHLYLTSFVEGCFQRNPDDRVVAKVALQYLSDFRANKKVPTIPPAQNADDTQLLDFSAAVLKGNSQMVLSLCELYYRKMFYPDLPVRHISNTYQTVSIFKKKGHTNLMKAAAHGNVADVQRYILELGYRTKDGMTALIWSILAGNPQCIKLLFPEMNIPGPDGVLPIEIMLQHDNKAIYRSGHFLLKFSKPPSNTKSEILSLIQNTGNAPKTLLEAAAVGDLKMVKKLIGESRYRGPRKETALMCAASKGYQAIVKLLANEESRQQDVDGRTALMLAAEEGHSDVVAFLGRYETRVQDRAGWTALMYAIREHHTSCVRPLLSEASFKTTEEVAYKGYAFPIGSTALDIAERLKFPEIVSVLKANATVLMNIEQLEQIEHDEQEEHEDYEEQEEHAPDERVSSETSKNVQSEPHRTEHSASEDEEEEDDNDDNDDDDTLIMAATRGDAKAVEKHIQEAGLTNDEGLTALMYAAKNGHLECVKILSDIEGSNQTRKGVTALMFAAQFGHLHVIKYLLNKESRIRDNNGWTALTYALYRKKQECAKELLIEEHLRTTKGFNGVPPNSSALDVARLFKCNEIVQLLKGK